MTSSHGSSWVDQVKGWSVADVANRLGLEVLRRGNDVSFACPACGKQLRHTKSSAALLAAKVMPDGRWWCEPCGAGGDAVALACAVATGKTQLTTETWRPTRAALVAVGLVAHGGEPIGTPSRSRPPPRPSLALVATPTYPPIGAVADFWASCTTTEPASAEARYLAARGFDVNRLHWLQMVRVAPRRLARQVDWWPSYWLHQWRLVFAAYDSRGELRSLHARSVSDATTPKTRWPLGKSSRGLLFADGVGCEFLRAAHSPDAVRGLQGIFVAEGATDTLKLAGVLDSTAAMFGALGYVQGSKSALSEIDWPQSVPCIIATDDDQTGDKYAAEIRQALAPRIEVYRVRAPLGRTALQRKSGDWSDMTDRDVLSTITDASKWEACHD